MKRKFTLLNAALALLVLLALPMGMRGQAPVNTVLWAEDFSGYAANDVPSGTITDSHTGTTVYGGVTLTYACNGSGTKIYVDTQMGGSSQANLLIAKGNGSFSVSGISTGGASELTVTYAKTGQGTLVISSATNGVSISGSDSGSTITTNGASTIDLVFTNTNGSKNLRFDDVEVTVKTAGGGQQLTPSDLALVDAPVELEFDLYDNADAQTISYTTSSTGAVTVSQSDYITATVNANSTITVTPVAVTNGTQTITINQAADNTYAAGSVTFTVDIENSAPTTSSDVTFNAATDTGTSPLVKEGVTFACTSGVLNNESEYRLYKNSVTTFSVSEGTITQIAFTGVSGNPASGFANQTGWITNGYNGTWSGSATSVSFTASNAQVRATQIVVTVETSGTSAPSISAENVTIAYDATVGSIEYTIDNPVTGGTLTAATTAEWLTIGTVGESSVQFTCEANEGSERTAIVTLIYTYGTDTATKEVTVTQAANPNRPGTENNPYTVAQAIDNTPASGTSETVYIHGVVSSFYNTSIVGDGNNYRYYISDDGTPETQLLVYKGKGLNQATFTNVNDLLVGDEVVICGKLTMYQSAPEIAANNYLVSRVTPAVPTVTVAETTINVGYEGIIDTLAVTYENITEVAAEVYFCDANGNAATFDWITAQIVAENNVEYTVEPNNGETRTAYFKVWAYDDDLNEVYSELVTVTQTAPPYSLTIGTLTHVTEILLFNSDNESQQIDVVNNVALITEGTTVMVSVEVEQGYVVQSLNVTYGDNQSAGITELEPNVYYSFEMPAANATLTITAVEPPQPAIYTYVKANSIQSGKHYIIVNEGAFKAMGLQNSNNRAAVDIEIIDANATAEYGKAYEFVITDLNETNTDNEALYSIYDVINEGYLCAASSSSNYLKMQNTLDDNGKWTIAIAEDGKATIKAQGSYTRNLMRYNSGSSLFSCYGSGQQDIYLYERVYTINITAHGDNENPTGWYLIASPLAGEINPTTIEGMIVTDDETTSNIDESEYFDLYRFDQSADLEWKNYKNNSFNLVSGQGYLYANANGVTLTFTGTPYEGNGKVGLVYSNDTNLDFPGWNLVGNPFGVAATINRDFYSMNENGSEIVVGSSSIAAMEGVFVIATKANDTVTFNTTASAKSSEEIPIEVTVGRGSVIDRAIVRFGEGSTMPKFQLFENSTKLYIEQNGKDYAIVSAEAQGEMPVSFRAAKNGTYTLTVNPEGVEMNYLHLIDNMTGIDIDLLQTPNYTFEARTTDYISRFRLVFGANGASAGSASDETFAYFNGNEWMINNSGDATLQVVDVMGRVFSSEVVSGSVSKTINATPGVYLIRLINGDNIKIQKIVVR